jgi:prepilin-type N-terminal cleavage/methylation domain-containing protein
MSNDMKGRDEMNCRIASHEHFPPRGYTLMELMIAASLFLVAMLIATMSFRAAIRSFNHQKALLDNRQNGRKSLASISEYLRLGRYIYTDMSVTIEGHTYTIPAVGASSKELLFAYPCSGIKGGIRYCVVGLYLRTRIPADSANRSASQLMLYMNKGTDGNGIVPQTADDPATIDLDALTRGSLRMIADYVYSPGGENDIFVIGDKCKDVDIALVLRQRFGSREVFHTERFVTSISLRNNF